MPTPTFSIGDLVEWQKLGVRGTYHCRIVALDTQAQKPYVIEIVGHSWNSNSPHIGERHAVSGEHLRQGG
jgi:hypothetical protein